MPEVQVIELIQRELEKAWQVRGAGFPAVDGDLVDVQQVAKLRLRQPACAPPVAQFEAVHGTYTSWAYTVTSDPSGARQTSIGSTRKTSSTVRALSRNATTRVPGTSACRSMSTGRLSVTSLVTTSAGS